MKRVKVAVKELELLQDIIARQDKFRAQTKQWAVTLVAAVVTAFFTNQVQLNPLVLWFLVVITCFLFLFVEAIFGYREGLAEDRTRVVESALQEVDAPTYDGPRICDAMQGRITRSRMIDAIRHPRCWGFYLILAFLGGLPELFHLLAQ